jgi:hypothetical protein
METSEAMQGLLLILSLSFVAFIISAIATFFVCYYKMLKDDDENER